MSGISYALESDEMFESDEAYDEALESDESDEFSERRKRFGKPGRIAPGRTATGKGLFRPRQTSNAYVTQTQLQAALDRTGKQIQTTNEAVKKVAAQATKVTADLGAATTRLDKQTSELKKEVKKQSEMTLLLTLLTPRPEIEVRPGFEGTAVNSGQTAASALQVKRTSNLLPLVLLSGSGGGLGGGDSSNLLILALALGGQL